MGHQWAWKFNDHPRSLKESVHTLLRCVGGNGNLLFNIGPDSSGVFPADFAARAREMGSWIEKNKPAIYNTKGGVYTPAKDYVSSFKGNKLYIHLLTDSTAIHTSGTFRKSKVRLCWTGQKLISRKMAKI